VLLVVVDVDVAASVTHVDRHLGRQRARCPVILAHFERRDDDFCRVLLDS
jgi:hypothetical protein